MEIVKWKLDLPRCPYLEERTETWADPGVGNDHLSRADLRRHGNRPLDNDGSLAIPWTGSDNRVSFSPSRIGEGKGNTLGASTETSRESYLDSYFIKAIDGRQGRAETCIVNAAIKATGEGEPVSLNKPIVVDIDLPVWR